MTKTPTVFVVDDEPAMRDSLQFLIGSVGIAVKCYASAEEFLASYDPRAPGCIVLDVRMPGLSGLELHEKLVEDRFTPPVLMITGHGDVQMAVRAMKVGAMNFIEKPFSDQLLLEHIHHAIDVDAKRRHQFEELEVLESRRATLSPREKEVFDLVAAGKPNKVVAHELGLSQKTIEVHRAHAMKKMKADTFADLVKMAVTLDASDAQH
jgi:two-component system, LuxR family, response regulator FixJ